jgi:cyclic beta-1,2-glucan synthetase
MTEDHIPNNGAIGTISEQRINFADRLAEMYGQASPRDPGYSIASDLSAYKGWLVQAHAYFRDTSREQLTLTYNSEWVLDNYYIIRQALRQIKEDLPQGFYTQLPKLTSDSLEGFARIHMITREMLANQNLLVNINDVQPLLVQLQDSVPLTMGELWAVPIFLRYGLIEALSLALERTLEGEIQPKVSIHTPVTEMESGEQAWTNAASRQLVQAGDTNAVANAILSLRAISEQDWNDFFDNTSRTERILREDPLEIYPLMDFKSRDLYRKEIEKLAFATGRDENNLAEICLELAREGQRANGNESVLAHRKAHIGYYLLDAGRPEFEERINYHPHGKEQIRRWSAKNASGIYLGSIFVLTFLLMVLFVWWAGGIALGRLAGVVISALMIIPAITITTSLVNWLATMLLPPSVLPKLSFRGEIPEPFHTLVAVPAMITHAEEVDSLLRQIEMHFLRNPEPGLRFALLTDFGDADSETLPEDDALVQRAVEGIGDLNDRYLRSNGEQPFFLLHRPRRWNPGERKWMGWERKRGKLHQLNQLLLNQHTGEAFSRCAGDLDLLKSVRFVLTLDADSVLPRGAARRMVGTLAHPLNQAVFDEKAGQVVSGYTVLQPRMEISPISANRSWFTRIFAGDTGLDLYTLAVSDAYQDVFGEGIFVGKGIYDVASFERSVAGNIPENSLLSHDLLEGLMGRAGLVTDITMVEDYPPNYYAAMLRQHRWIRGDWQLLPWLLFPSKFGLHLSAVDRWKVIDNLRRSLLPVALLILFVVGTLWRPNLTVLWTAVLLMALGVPLLLSLARGAHRSVLGETFSTAFLSLRADVIRWVVAVAFLPYEAYKSVDAVVTTLYRMLVSRRNLLQWATAAHVARLFGMTKRRVTWQKMGAVSLLALLLGAAIAWQSPAALWASAPVLLLWLVSPLIAYWINLPIPQVKRDVTSEQAALLRRLTRRTWAFFERFVGPEDHWLPPDHFQESPVGVVAHRTSPTNIGLLLNSTLAAYDMGYLDSIGLSTRLSATMDTLQQLDRFRGHFLNWYDTQTLQTLNPRYVSTVDSGNLSASLIVTARACRAMEEEPVFRWEMWQGYLDTLSLLGETLTGLHQVAQANLNAPAAARRSAAEGVPTRPSDAVRQLTEIEQKIYAMTEQITGAREEPRRWYGLYQTASGPFWEDVSGRLAALIASGRAVFDLESLRGLQEVASQVAHFHLAAQRTISQLSPWIPLLESKPALFESVRFQPQMAALRETLSYSPKLRQIRAQSEAARGQIANLRAMIQDALAPEGSREPARGTGFDALQEAPAVSVAGAAVEEEAALAWLDALDQAVMDGSARAGALLSGFALAVVMADQYVNEMDFQFLYNPLRRIFHIGYNVDGGQLDNNYYDLLASEARIASIIAIARGEVPQSHWLHLGRPVTEVEGRRVLLSWSATMFEYLMPPLFLPSYPGTLLTESAYGAVEHQIAYGKSKDLPWGISESGFYRFDANQSYQYRAFGVPGLGFKRGLGDYMVVAPYASLMAVAYHPQAVLRNIADLIRHKGLGLWGFYEAIDFTTERLLLGEKSAVVKEYMAHHQGMILLAIVNYFHDDIMVRRMMSDPRLQSVDLLLQEQVPPQSSLLNPFAEDVKGTQRQQTTAVETVSPWTVPVQTPIPQAHLLSNGSYSVLISNSGGGYSTWRGTDLTRWQPDGVLDPWGTWIYIQDMQSPLPMSVKEDRDNNEALWSAGFQPVTGNPNDTRVTFFAHMAVFHRTQNGIVSTMEVTVTPEDPVEIRRVNLNNSDDRPRLLRLTSYGEVVLNQQANDTRHPAFNKLFIESEWVENLNLQIFKRRPRSEKEAPVYMGHMLLTEENVRPTLAHEADRARFLGRGQTPRRPAGLVVEGYLSGTSGATLDPIFALGQEVELGPHENVRLVYITIAGESWEEIVALAQRYRSWTQVDRSFHHANLNVQAWLSKHNIDSQALASISQVLSALVFPFPAARTTAEVIASNRLGQSGLWRFGVSGDYPILMVQVDDATQLDLVREALQTHRFLRSRRFLSDVVIINQQQTDYGAELNGMLYRLVSHVNSEQWLNQRGGVFILYADQMQEEERTLLKTAARVLLAGSAGSMAEQMPGYSIKVPHLPDLTPTREAVPVTELAPAVSILDGIEEGLQFFNGYGGFSADGREYVITLPGDKPTPAPWANVVGYPHFGFLVTEAGSQCTWALNSGENRLTPWSNDPVRDPSEEVLYLRDEETGEVWTPTPLPSGEEAPFIVRHGAGYTVFEHESHGLRQRLTLFASPDDPVKLIHLEVQNTRGHTRRITATEYVGWVLGTTHANSQQYLIPEYEPARECLLVSNPYNTEFSARVGFLASSKPVHGLTADRTEFFGRNGSIACPAALRRIGLETRITAGEDTCGVLQVHMDLAPGGTEEIYFILGQGDSREHAQALVDRYHEAGCVGAAWERTQAFWDRLLDTIKVQTPQPSSDLILNRWSLYQTLSCRVWGRTAFYQSSGAFGFRDQLQDVLALLSIDPAIARSQILNAAAHQFEAGDVLHWWHPPSGRGVRTRFSDDLLWLPYVTSLYIVSTGDIEILREKHPFLHAPELKPGEEERYGEYPSTTESFTLYEHCRRAIERGSSIGPHRLPLMGTGDWNDGMNRVGVEGKGESVWLAWFLCDVMARFADVCVRAIADPRMTDLEVRPDQASTLRARIKDYAAAIEKSAWDGAWYRRAYYDSGDPLGSVKNMECEIDSIAQSWSVLSGAGDAERSKQAMQSTLDRLVLPNDRLLLLFTPPFDQTPQDPGYIKGYLPGIRENGGQYTHAATWTAWAFARLGDGKQAGALYDLLNPVLQSENEDMASTYRVEPYVVCADIYSVRPYLRRGGWTWYTGSAAWMYRLGLEAILGFQRTDDRLQIDPCIPPEWDGFTITYRYGSTTYTIQVNNPQHVTKGVRRINLDGQGVEANVLLLTDDGIVHVVTVEMG